MSDITKILSDFHNGIAAPEAVAQDAAAECVQEDAFADIRIALDSMWDESKVVRKPEGEGGGQFAEKPENALKRMGEKEGDLLSKTTGAFGNLDSVKDALFGVAKGAAPIGTRVEAAAYTERGIPTAAVRLTPTDRSRLSAEQKAAVMQAMEDAGFRNVEEGDQEGHTTTIFADPPVSEQEAAANYMAEVGKAAQVSSSGKTFTPREGVDRAIEVMAGETDDDNPSKRIRIAYEEWTPKSAIEGVPASTGFEDEETDGREFSDPRLAAKWMLEKMGAVELDGETEWFTGMSPEDAKGGWRVYSLFPVNYTAAEIGEMNRRIAQKDVEQEG